MEIAGTFNSWQRVPMTYERSTGNWVFTIALSPGHYQYKYIVNDEWKVDPAKPTEYDNVGNLNNKIDVK
jgi:5'-AMP-activated protein kinase regulatory beta subunit